MLDDDRWRDGQIMPRAYVALGDSYCAGLDVDDFKPWPVLVSRELGNGSAEWSFASLAKNGATSADVKERQMAAAIALEPKLVTVCCGANDVLLKVAPNFAAFERNLGSVLDGLCRARSKPKVLTVTYGDFASHMRYRERSRLRVARGMAQVNRIIRATSSRYGVMCVDIAADFPVLDARMIGPDGIHPSALGHVRTAGAVLEQLKRGWRPSMS